MQTRFSPSVNIIRDAGKALQYISTPNAKRIADAISADFKKGTHAFTLIGSYGTGKSSFLWALEKSLTGKGPLAIDLGYNAKKIETLRFVGQYQSLIDHFREHFDINKDFEGNQKILDCLFQVQEKADLLVIYLDEFGKFLEYAAKNQPEKELYFLQQLAEFANDESRKVLLITTLHQNFEAYSANLSSETLKAEWKKIRGRLKELTFNEPVEQLLYLAAKRLQGQNKGVDSRLALAKKHHIISDKSQVLDELQNELAPLDVVSAAVLVEALKLYGQNERSLFSFLESDIHREDRFHVAHVYDYLLNAFYSLLNSPANGQFRHWQGLQHSLERIDVAFAPEDIPVAEQLFKTICLLQIHAPEGASVDAAFLKSYFDELPGKKIDAVLKVLAEKNFIYYAAYRQSFVLKEGTDLDFDRVLLAAGESIDMSFDIVPLLKEHFEFPFIQAKAVSYERGTPRLFQFEIGTHPTHRKPSGETDGIVNLLFNENLGDTDLIAHSQDQPEAIVYAHFTNAASIREHLFEIQKTKKALTEHSEDKVAKREFQNILKAREQLLTHEVLGALFTDKVNWYFRGKEKVTDNKALNKLLSKVCYAVYDKTPKFNNELANKHKISSSIHTARKNYFDHLCLHWQDEHLGFAEDKFPPEKTIYKSLLKTTGMHQMGVLKPPAGGSTFLPVWKECQDFLNQCRREQQPVSALIRTLSERPYKLKQGLIDFWVPTFLFIQRNDFALFETDRDGTRFVPQVNKDILYNITRYPENFTIKAFQFDGLRIELFNRYREVAKQPELKHLSTEAFIESVRPFLVFYKQLNDYGKNTQRLSAEAIAFRQALVNAKDPEQTFFETIPRALGADLSELAVSDEAVKAFAVRLNDCIEELKTAYERLLDRLELFIQLEILGGKMDFAAYKKSFQKRFAGIREHRLLNHQKVFLQRVLSALDDRDSWLASIAHALLGKPLHQIKDAEEDTLHDRLRHIVRELDNLREIQKSQKEDGDEVIRLDLTSEDGLKTNNIRIPKGKQEEVNALRIQVEALLKNNKQLKLAVLAQLLKKELDK